MNDSGQKQEPKGMSETIVAKNKNLKVSIRFKYFLALSSSHIMIIQHEEHAQWCVVANIEW